MNGGYSNPPRTRSAPPPPPRRPACTPKQPRPGKGPEPTATVLTAPRQWHLPRAVLPPPPQHAPAPPPGTGGLAPLVSGSRPRRPGAARGRFTGNRGRVPLYAAGPGWGGVAPLVSGLSSRRPCAASTLARAREERTVRERHGVCTQTPPEWVAWPHWSAVRGHAALA